MAAAALLKDQPRTLFGWCMYDWANSAYATTVLAGLLPVYFAEEVVGADGVQIGGRMFSATELWAYAVAAAALLAFVCAPVLGAVADCSAAKKRFLLTFAYVGSLFTLLLYLCRTGDVALTMIFFIVAQFGFIAANVFYDAFLPQIVSESRLDRVSGRGYAYGYVGGGLQFALSLILVVGHERLDLDEATAVRLALLMAGLWWGGFTLITVYLLREAPALETLPDRYRRWPPAAAYTAVGISRTIATIRRVGRFRHLVLFLVAFMLYNDGIQTVIDMATIYGKDELHLDTAHLMLTLLVIQVIAVVGALAFSRVAERVGTKRAIMLTLMLWTAVVTYACFIHTKTEYFVLGVVVGFALGGAQALSRSFYGSMIPEVASAEFFGFYSVFNKFSAIWGPLAFGLIRSLTGTARGSIAALSFFFLAGLVLLYFVDEKQARRAKLAGAF